MGLVTYRGEREFKSPFCLPHTYTTLDTVYYVLVQLHRQRKDGTEAVIYQKILSIFD